EPESDEEGADQEVVLRAAIRTEVLTREDDRARPVAPRHPQADPEFAAAGPVDDRVRLLAARLERGPQAGGEDGCGRIRGRERRGVAVDLGPLRGRDENARGEVTGSVRGESRIRLRVGALPRKDERLGAPLALLAPAVLHLEEDDLAQGV